jgi:hypothetical protein
MKRILFYFLAIISIGAFIAGCDQFDEYESSEVLAQPTTTLTISAVEDSSFVLDVSTDMAGYLGYVVASDTTLTAPEAITIISGSLDGASGVLDINTYQLESAGGQSATMVDLMPNTYYKVFAASSNADGVESVVEMQLVKTDDGIGPTFVSSSPGISNQPTVAIGTSIVLTFDEPIQVNPEKKFTFTYYFEEVTVDVSVDNESVSGKTVTIPQPRDGHAGDYFFLSWEAGAVEDLSGNACAERVSGVIEGSLRGNYYRFVKVPFEFALTSVVPANGSVISLADTYVDISYAFPVELSEDLTDDMVKFRYTSFDGKVVTEVSAAEYCEIIDDTTLRVTQPHEPAAGDVISLYLEEGVVLDGYGNPNEASDFVLNWTLPRLTIESLVGEYTVSGISYFDESVVTDIVTIILDPENPNGLLISGLFESLTGTNLHVEGIFDAATSTILIQEQVIGVDDTYYYTVSSVSGDYSITVTIGEDGNMTSVLALNLYDLEFNWIGYGEYVPSATWTKSSTKSSVLRSTNERVIKSIPLRQTTSREIK